MTKASPIGEEAQNNDEPQKDKSNKLTGVEAECGDIACINLTKGIF